MRISLVTRHADAVCMPLALMYIKAALVDHAGLDETDLTILEFPPAVGPEKIAEAVLASEPDVVALSCYVWNVIDLMAAVALVKSARPDVHVVIGGPEVGSVAGQVLAKYPSVDVVVKSEGEIPMIELARRWLAGSSVDDVAGIWRRNEQGSPLEHPDAEILADLNWLPSPHMRNYVDATRRIVSIETQRGCVFRCSFCFYNKDLSIRNRRFDLDRVKGEIAYWLERDIEQLFLMDPVFNLNAARAKEICRFIAEHNHRRIPVHSEVWAEFIDDEMAALMKAANFKFVEVGLQTTDTTSLQVVERRLRLEPFLNGVRALQEHGVAYELQLIAGLPSDTVESFCESVDFAARLRPDHLAAYTLMVLPGTELWRQASALGLEYDSRPPYEIRATPAIGAAEMRRLRRMAMLVQVLWMSQTVRALCREPGMTLSRLIQRWVEWEGDVPDDAMTNARRALLRLPEFVDEHCANESIPPAFYRQLVRQEVSVPGAARV